MAITWIDGFDMYSATVLPQLSGRYTSNNADTPEMSLNGRFSGSQAIRFKNNNGNTFAFTPLGAGSDTPLIGIALRCNGTALTSVAQRQIAYFMNGATVIATLSVTSAGRLQFHRGNQSTLLAETAAGVVTANTWSHIQCGFLRDASVGTVDIRVNGTSVITGTALNTGASIIDTIQLISVQSLSADNDILVDDLFVKNDLGFPGDLRVETLRPTADTAVKNWSRSAGSDNYALVDETACDGDTTYVSSATVSQKDNYAMGELVEPPIAVHAVQATIIARKDDATVRTVAGRVKSSAAVAGTTHTMGTSYGAHVHIAAVDPNTAGSWAAAAVDAAQLEIEVIS